MTFFQKQDVILGKYRRVRYPKASSSQNELYVITSGEIHRLDEERLKEKERLEREKGHESGTRPGSSKRNTKRSGMMASGTARDGPKPDVLLRGHHINELEEMDVVRKYTVASEKAAALRLLWPDVERVIGWNGDVDDNQNAK